MFLGTGLGPRAYAIIGQGMISRIVEARPEELRIFLEEAAGVSKYKERRRETENRLADTRDNLTRVEDILRELEAQIGKLEHQAAVAQTYRSLQATARRAAAAALADSQARGRAPSGPGWRAIFPIARWRWKLMSRGSASCRTRAGRSANRSLRRQRCNACRARRTVSSQRRSGEARIRDPADRREPRAARQLSSNRWSPPATSGVTSSAELRPASSRARAGNRRHDAAAGGGAGKRRRA